MKIVPLTEQEAARTGFNHVINLKVTGTGTGDIATVGAVANVTAVPIGMTCQAVGVDLKAAFAGMATPTLDVGFAASLTASTNIIAAASLSAASYVVANPTASVSTASQFITVRNNGTGSATAGEVNVLLRLVDITQPRNTFP